MSSIESPPKYRSSIIWLCCGIQFGELAESFVQGQQIHGPFLSPARRRDGFIQGQPSGARSPLGGAPPALVIHQDPAHQLSGDADKMGAIFDLQRFALGQSHIHFVDERGALQGVIRAFLFRW